MNFLETKERQFEREFDSMNEINFKEVITQARDFLESVNTTTPTIDKYMQRNESELDSHAQN